MSKSKAKNKNKQTPGMLVTSVCLILVAVLVVGLGGWKVLDELRVIDLVDGLMDRNRIVASSDNFELTGSELSVYEFQAAQVYYQQAQMEYYYYQSYLTQQGYTSASQYAAYAVASYREQGVLEEQAFHYAEQYLAFCEGAKAAGFALAEDDKQVDDYIQQLKDAAESAKMNFGRYIRNEFGLAIRESDIRSAMEKYFLFSGYAEKLEKGNGSWKAENAGLLACRSQNKANPNWHEYRVLLRGNRHSLFRQCVQVPQLRCARRGSGQDQLSHAIRDGAPHQSTLSIPREYRNGWKLQKSSPHDIRNCRNTDVP